MSLSKGACSGKWPQWCMIPTAIHNMFLGGLYTIFMDTSNYLSHSETWVHSHSNFVISWSVGRERADYINTTNKTWYIYNHLISSFNQESTYTATPDHHSIVKTWRKKQHLIFPWYLSSNGNKVWNSKMSRSLGKSHTMDCPKRTLLHFFQWQTNKKMYPSCIYIPQVISDLHSQSRTSQVTRYELFFFQDNWETSWCIVLCNEYNYIVNNWTYTRQGKLCVDKKNVQLITQPKISFKSSLRFFFHLTLQNC